MQEFMAYHRRLDCQPRIKDIQEYGLSWEAWHEELKAKAGYRVIVKGGDNSISLLILAFRWWADAVDELEDGDFKVWSMMRVGIAMKELDSSMTGILESGALERAMAGQCSMGEDSEVEICPMKRYAMSI